MQNDEMAVFHKKVKALRVQNGITKKEMAKLLNIGVGSLNKLENGILPPRMTVEVVFLLSDHF